MIQSAIYTGDVFHKRFVPKAHSFSYSIYLMWLKLDEIDELSESISWFSSEKLAPVQFKREDYMGGGTDNLSSVVLKKMSALANKPLIGDIYFLGQTRVFGWYFSPVNFYFLRHNNQYTHMLAEVSNTPWNEKHVYLVDLKEQADALKAFYVSPFNPMDMIYEWQIKQPDENLNLQLSCNKDIKHFTAALNMKRIPLTSKTMRSTVLSIPSLTIKTVVGIYWQATKLFFKRIPVYTNLH